MIYRIYFFLPFLPSCFPAFLPSSFPLFLLPLLPLFFSRFTSFMNLQQGLLVVGKSSTAFKESKELEFETRSLLLMNDLGQVI